jgi:4-hydroxy-tetrahydrodipicolinate synthase
MTRQMPPLFTGIGVALVTIFDRGGEVDAKATAALADQLVAAGVRAVVVAGTTGEASTLSPAERVALIKEVRSTIPADVPVLAGTGAPTGQLAASLTAAAVDAGADGLLVLSPPGVVDPRRYYATVAAAADERPVLAYHFPEVSAPGIDVATLPALPVAGVKDSSGSAERLLAEVADYDGATYTGSAALLIMAGAIGATGAILAPANIEPELCAAAFAGDSKAQLGLLAAHTAAAVDFPAGLKRLAADRWGCSPVTRIGS